MTITNKRSFLISVFTLLSSFIYSQTEEWNIFSKAFESAKAITEGYYEMEHSVKYLSNEDTATSIHHCYFIKEQTDSTVFLSFHNKRFRGQKFFEGVLHTSSEYVLYFDSVGYYFEKPLWVEEINDRVRRINLFPFLKDKNRLSGLVNNDSTRHTYTVTRLADEVVAGRTCYQIKVHIPMNETVSNAQDIHLIDTEVVLWIDKSDYLTLQYSEMMNLFMFNDSVTQYNLYSITNFDFHQTPSEKHFSLSSIPDDILVSDYQPVEESETMPLEVGSIAPNFKLPTFDGDFVELSQFKGNVVLLDFFYKSCYPCIKAIPFLSSMHSTYQDQGLVVVGVNPVDKKNDLQSFMSRHGIAYSIALDGKEAAKMFNVKSYPTLYVIDQNGKVAYAIKGFGDSVKEELELVVKKLINDAN